MTHTDQPDEWTISNDLIRVGYDNGTVTITRSGGTTQTFNTSDTPNDGAIALSILRKLTGENLALGPDTLDIDADIDLTTAEAALVRRLTEEHQ